MKVSDIFQDGIELEPETTFDRIMLKKMIDGIIECESDSPSFSKFKIKIVEREALIAEMDGIKSIVEHIQPTPISIMVCPACGNPPKSTCKCPRHDCECENGHRWHRCMVHNKIVIGESDHSLPMHVCTCDDSDDEVDGRCDTCGRIIPIGAKECPFCL